MVEDERLHAVKALVINHVSTPSLRRIRDAWAVHLLAQEILEKLDHRAGIWRKWNDQREELVKSATDCWIPIVDLQEYLNGMQGPPLTRMDVAQRLRAFQDEGHRSPPNEEMKPVCLDIFEREKAEGTELPAIIGAIQEWLDKEELRLFFASMEARRKQVEEDKIALEQRLLSGADCKWTPLDNSAEVYCRTNGRTYRLLRTGNKMLDLHRIKNLDDQQSLLIGTYRTRADATKVVAESAYQPEPRW
ncbi:MAG: hypothetical protein CFE28_16190 [Alphaproteobacteria bacterium PA2]|nr:MAG: hypothetical protein CFE28_16190 [Alphaproteobacteria bacterium PA2]